MEHRTSFGRQGKPNLARHFVRLARKRIFLVPPPSQENNLLHALLVLTVATLPLRQAELHTSRFVHGFDVNLQPEMLSQLANPSIISSPKSNNLESNYLSPTQPRPRRNWENDLSGARKHSTTHICVFCHPELLDVSVFYLLT